MRQLYLIRHGNVSHDHVNSDYQRSLTDEGIAEAVRAGECLQQQKVVPQVFIHSDALRTTMTAETIARTLHSQAPLIPIPELYNASSEKWPAVIAALDDDTTCVVAVGHNFGITGFATYLQRATLPEMQNCSIYGFQFNTASWHRIDSGAGKLILTFHP